MLTANRAAPSHSPFVKPLMRNTADREQGGAEPFPLRKAVDEEYDGNHRKHEADEDMRHGVYPLFEGGLFRLACRKGLCRLPEQRVFTRRRDDANAAAADDVRAHEREAAAICERTRLARLRLSAGIISPAERCTSSPTASSDTGISFLPSPLRETQVVVVIIAESFSAAAPLRDSCTKRRMPDTATMTAITMTVM